ncbi:MAG: hypothetical protein SLAVMIC_00754 [uncultured marine phage]|uniref:Uncharacterized protein n=1 Tax=uncultured marine phage TaxID=707152 RepID=A0A8D9CAK1_9VIRU|nr:MAG: hypothetical protein SLAVMIC_00754 [uncultured marine phage]
MEIWKHKKHGHCIITEDSTEHDSVFKDYPPFVREKVMSGICVETSDSYVGELGFSSEWQKKFFDKIDEVEITLGKDQKKLYLVDNLLFVKAGYPNRDCVVDLRNGKLLTTGNFSRIKIGEENKKIIIKNTK